MVRFSVPLLAAGLVAGCTSPADSDGDNTGNGPCEVDCNTDPEATAFLTPSLTLNGQPATTVASITGPTTTTVQTGTEAQVKPGDYTVKFGDDSDGQTLDGHNLILDPNTGWYFAALQATTTVGDGDEARVAQIAYMVVEGTWTCDFNDGSEPISGSVSYTDNAIYLPGVGTLTVTDLALDRTGDGFEQHGQFISDTLAHVTNVGGMTGDYDADCWAGTGANDPR